MAQGRHSRTFTPLYEATQGVALPSELVIFDRTSAISRISVPERYVAFFVDGACRRNGQQGAIAAYSVWSGQDSRFNYCGTLPERTSHTSQAAEIFAAKEAVKIIETNPTSQVWQDGVVIITDSDYLYRSITDYIYTWEMNGFLTVNREPVVNRDVLSALHSSILNLESRGIKILFWRVDRAFNTDADRLASFALDQSLERPGMRYNLGTG